MNSHSYITMPAPVQMPDMMPPQQEVPELLRQMLELQREQVTLLRTQVAAQDNLSRWKAFLNRWSDEFPDIGGACKQVLPVVERAYLVILKELTDRLQGDEADDITEEFVLNEFLDRYGIRLGQLATIISQLAPLADAAPAPQTDGTN